MSRLQVALDQIETARKYSLGLIEDVKQEDWFRQPAEGVTHIAWQVGHLAIAQYFLALMRVRGKEDGDFELIPESYAGLFGKGSTPDPDPKKYPTRDEIRAVLDRVHQKAIEEARTIKEEELDEGLTKPHPMFSTKIGALQFCSQHEMLHAGQIGLLRRLLGYGSLR